MQADFDTPHDPGAAAAQPARQHRQGGKNAGAGRIRLVPPADAEATPTRSTVLTVFAVRGHREMVHLVCHDTNSGNTVVDVASATDAVLTLLTEPIDLVLVDADLAGDLLGALQRHASRSAPHAKLAVFGSTGAAAESAAGQRSHGPLPWSQLEATLRGLLANGAG